VTDPFNSSPAPAADPFGAPGGMADPFGNPSGGGGMGPRGPKDLAGRLVAWRKRGEQEVDGYRNPGFTGDVPKVIRFTIDIAVLDGEETVYASPGADAPFGAKPEPCGKVGDIFRGRYFTQNGIKNKFNDSDVILGRVGMLGKNADFQKQYDTIEKVAAWLATNPSAEDVKRADLFWTIDAPTAADREIAMKWFAQNRDFLK